MKLHPPQLHSDEQINQDLLRPIFHTSWKWWVALAICAGGFFSGAGAWAYMVSTGMWVTDLHRPVMWGLMIANFVFWIGLSHSGTLISAILRLAKAEWRRPITRAAEAMTVFTVMMAAQYPIMHLGRTWFFYWVVPGPNQRLLWPNFRSPLAWDLFAITTYLTGSMIYLYIPAIPDFAIARDHSDGWKRIFYNILALGWRGTGKEWKTLNVCILLLAVLILPVAVSVHTIVSWDFAMALVPQWHTTIFGPYFVLGAIYSGMALVITLTVLIRWLFGWQKYITPYHLDKLGKVMLCASLVWFYLWFGDYLVTWYGKLPEESIVMGVKNAGPFFWAQATMMLANTAIAIPCLCFKKFRSSPGAMLALTLFINVGMWLERFLIVSPSLTHKGPAFTWSTYTPTWVEWSVTAYPFFGFVLLYLLFVKMCPLIAIWEIREDKAQAAEKKVGIATVRALVAE